VIQKERSCALIISATAPSFFAIHSVKMSGRSIYLPVPNRKKNEKIYQNQSGKIRKIGI
jgi:Mor family transcriptional regulator